MKKLVFGIALIAMMALSSCGGRYCPESDFAVVPIGGSAVMIVGYNGDSWTVRIPSRIRNMPVTHIGDFAFEMSNLTSVTIPNTVTHIGYRAFWMNRLSSVSIPNSVTHISEMAFADNRLSSVTVPRHTVLREAAHFDWDGDRTYGPFDPGVRVTRR